MVKRALIILSNFSSVIDARDFDIVICADSGLDTAIRSGIRVDLIVGDMDSVSMDSLQEARKLGYSIEEHPTDKDMSDGELAFRAALKMDADHIRLMGGRTGRMDHVVSTLLLPFIAPPSVNVVVCIDDEVFLPLRKKQSIVLSERYKEISIIPLSNDCRLSTSGMRWELDDEHLSLGTTKGIHNEITSVPYSIKCNSGMAVIHLSDRD